VATVAVTALTGNGGSAHASASRGVAAPSAAAVAQAWVASRPALLRVGPSDGFVQHAPLSSAGWSYVPYDRTYQGLPVVGGDFVVVIDPAGRVQAPSVAQQRPITAVAVPAWATEQAAARVAAGEGTRLVVYARSGIPRLAWESTNAADATTSYVDVVSGAVLERRGGDAHGYGYSGRNGPNPIPISTRHIHFSIYDRYYLIDPSGNGVTCGDVAVGQPYWQTVDSWGNGDSTNIVTGCVDAMFAQQEMIRMLAQWLGRSGVDGAGHGFPMWVGYPEGVDAWSLADHIVKIGTWYGPWLSSLDAVGHELGHAVDQYTPGGLSGKGTPEFIADVFGTATEWFAHEPAGFDTPDWIQNDGYAYDLPRHFWNATTPFDPLCYYSTIDATDPHSAATVGRRWFYMMAEGSNPTDGQPVAQTCNNTTVSPVGFMTALRILYNAMLMKTSDSSYPAYRQWTIRAAYNLYGCTGAYVNTVKAAWSAVGVSPQLAEPLCGILTG
jgi:zinc metalloprotease ZmpA